jgi:hypothetical protein
VCGGWLCVHAVFQKTLEKPMATVDFTDAGGASRRTLPPALSRASAASSSASATSTSAGGAASTASAKTQTSQSFSKGVPSIPTTSV